MRRNTRRNRATKGPAVEHSTADLIARAAEQIRNLQSRLADPDDLIGRHEVQRLLAQIEDGLKSTHGSSDISRTDDLVNESRSVTPTAAQSSTKIKYSSSDTSSRSTGRNSSSCAYSNSGGLVLKTLPQVGRATVSRARSKYFDFREPLSEEEQRERSRRSSEANLRAATRRAADHAVAADCGTWLTLTFDREVTWDEAAEHARQYLDTVARDHRKRRGAPCHYAAIVDVSQSNPHLHAVLSRGVEMERVIGFWRHGAVETIEEIHRDLVEQKIRYMSSRVKYVRATRQRFLRSRGLRIVKELNPVANLDDARDMLADRIAPQTPRLTSAQPFGGYPRITFRFQPIPSGDE